MRDIIKDFVKIVSETLPVQEPIYEFGSLQVEGQEGYADLRPYFAGREYVGCDLREGPGVDRVLDLHRIALPDRSVGAVLILDTIEHVEYPREAIAQIERILKPGGIAVASSVMNFPIHEYPHDFWRFTPDGMRSLLKPFPASFVCSAGEELFPHTVAGIGFKAEIKQEALKPFLEGMAGWKTRWFYQEGLSPEEIERRKEKKRKREKKLKNRIKRMLGGK